MGSNVLNGTNCPFFKKIRILITGKRVRMLRGWITCEYHSKKPEQGLKTLIHRVKAEDVTLSCHEMSRFQWRAFPLQFPTCFSSLLLPDFMPQLFLLGRKHRIRQREICKNHFLTALKLETPGKDNKDSVCSVPFWGYCTVP